jgi:hypothetical protein
MNGPGHKPLNLNPEKDIFEQHEYLPAPPDRATFIAREPDLLKLAADAYRALRFLTLAVTAPARHHWCQILYRSQGGDHAGHE